MAANCARRTLQFSSASAKTLLSRPPSSPFASKASKLTELTSLKPASAPRLAAQKLKFSRLPVELGGAQSLIPLHSATASALLTSLLSLHNTSWGAYQKVSLLHYSMARAVSRYTRDRGVCVFTDLSYDDLTFCMSWFEILKTRDREYLVTTL